MLASIGILLVTSSIFLIEMPHLLSKGNKKDIWIFSILLLFASGLGIAVAFQVKVPNPLDWVTFIYRPISDVMLTFFK